MSLIFLLLIFLHTFRVEPEILLAIAFIFVELVLVTAVAILFSSFSTPILSALFALSFYLIGHFSWSLETLLKKMHSGFGRAVGQVFYTLLPDLENFNFKTEVVYGLPIPPAIVGYALLYGALYTLFILTLAVMVFRKRDFI